GEDSVTLHVLAAGAPAVSPSSVSIGTDSTVHLSVAVDAPIVWRSADSTIAKVDSTGKVTGRRSGTTTITATTPIGTVGSSQVAVSTMSVPPPPPADTTTPPPP